MRYVFLAILVLGLSILAAAQDSDAKSVVTLPDDVMRQVVTRITKFYFKPARRPTVIYFSAKSSRVSETTLKNEWFPTIKNITFELIDANSSQIDRKGYLIELVKEEKKKNTYTIIFGYGDLVCGRGSGNSWTLRVSRSGIRMWPDGGGCGWGCSNDSFG